MSLRSSWYSSLHSVVATTWLSNALIQQRQLLAVAVGATAMTLGIAATVQAQSVQAQSVPAESVPAESAPAESPAVTTQISQVQTAPDQRVIEPPAAPTPEPTPFAPIATGIVDLSANSSDIIESVGHLRPRDIEAFLEDDVDWLQSVIVPLYVSPDGDHWGWIYQGWLIPKGQSYLAIGRDAGFAMVRSYENLYSFPVLEVREDGWFRVQYTAGGSAWAHTSQLGLGDTPLVVEGWESRLEEQAAVHFLQTAQAQPLRSQPELANNMLSLVAADSLIEPLDFAGDWMRVRVTRPTAACKPLTGATVTEGWMRWRDDDAKSLIWYEPDGSCLQGVDRQ